MDGLLVILVALCGAEFIHNSYEVWGIRKKANWLSAKQDGLKYGKWPININNKVKMITLHSLLLIIPGLIFYIVLKALDLPEHSLIITGIVILLANYIYTTRCVDIYHKCIDSMIAKAKK